MCGWRVLVSSCCPGLGSHHSWSRIQRPADWVAARTWRQKSHKCAWHIVLNVNICTFNLPADTHSTPTHSHTKNPERLQKNGGRVLELFLLLQNVHLGLQLFGISGTSCNLIWIAFKMAFIWAFCYDSDIFLLWPIVLGFWRNILFFTTMGCIHSSLTINVWFIEICDIHFDIIRIVIGLVGWGTQKTI